MKIDNQTKVYISASNSPGKFGATAYNNLFEKLGLNCIYIPRLFSDARKLNEAIRIMDIKGCSVSMPLKGLVIEYMDAIDEIAQTTGSVNTIVNNSGRLIGYNTDCYGIEKVLQKIQKCTVLIYGAGSVVNSIIYTIKKLKFSDITITARSFQKANESANKNGVIAKDINSLDDFYGLLINATPASLESKEKQLLSLLDKSEKVFDLVVYPYDTKFIAEAKRQKRETICGIEMCKYQMQKQFEYYIGFEPSIEVINTIVNDFYCNH
jgi:shikimate dehydrogenase